MEIKINPQFPIVIVNGKKPGEETIRVLRDGRVTNEVEPGKSMGLNLNGGGVFALQLVGVDGAVVASVDPFTGVSSTPAAGPNGLPAIGPNSTPGEIAAIALAARERAANQNIDANVGTTTAPTNPAPVPTVPAPATIAPAASGGTYTPATGPAAANPGAAPAAGSLLQTGGDQ